MSKEEFYRTRSIAGKLRGPAWTRPATILTYWCNSSWSTTRISVHQTSNVFYFLQVQLQLFQPKCSQRRCGLLKCILAYSGISTEDETWYSQVQSMLVVTKALFAKWAYKYKNYGSTLVAGTTEQSQNQLGRHYTGAWLCWSTCMKQFSL